MAYALSSGWAEVQLRRSPRQRGDPCGFIPILPATDVVSTKALVRK